MIRSANNDDDLFDDDGPALRPVVSPLADEQTIRALLDNLDTSADHYAYDADGLYLFEADTSADHSFLHAFHGPACDDDLHYDLIRHFDPTPGRLLSDEPLGFEADDMLNLYRHVSNQPAAASDPSRNILSRE